MPVANSAASPGVEHPGRSAIMQSQSASHHADGKTFSEKVFGSPAANLQAKTTKTFSIKVFGSPEAHLQAKTFSEKVCGLCSTVSHQANIASAVGHAGLSSASSSSHGDTSVPIICQSGPVGGPFSSSFNESVGASPGHSSGSSLAQAQPSLGEGGSLSRFPCGQSYSSGESRLLSCSSVGSVAGPAQQSEQQFADSESD